MERYLPNLSLSAKLSSSRFVLIKLCFHFSHEFSRSAICEDLFYLCWLIPISTPFKK